MKLITALLRVSHWKISLSAILIMSHCLRDLPELNYGSLLVLSPTDTRLEGPHIVVQEGNFQFDSGAVINFGTVYLGETAKRDFNLVNVGTETISLTGTPFVTLGGSDAAEYACLDVTDATLTPGSSLPFSVDFFPGSLGQKTANLTILSNDLDNPIFSLNLEGEGSTPPEINIKVGSMSYASGSTYDFGTLGVDLASNTITFTIENLGTADLEISSTPGVVISGTHSADIGVTQPDSLIVTGSSSKTFGLVFTPSAAGARAATITIESNDSDEDSYTINLTGNGLVLPDQCYDYEVFDTSDRYIGFGNPGNQTDAYNGWVRFGQPYPELATIDPGGPDCNAGVPAYFTGSLPSAIGNSTLAQQVCINSGSPCTYQQPIDVTHCGTFYVYNLADINIFYGARYCAQGSTM